MRLVGQDWEARYRKQAAEHAQALRAVQHARMGEKSRAEELQAQLQVCNLPPSTQLTAANMVVPVSLARPLAKARTGRKSRA